MASPILTEAALPSAAARGVRSRCGPPAGAAGATLEARAARSRSRSRALEEGLVEAAQAEEEEFFLASFDRYHASIRKARDAWISDIALWRRSAEIYDAVSVERAVREARRTGAPAQRSAARAEGAVINSRLQAVRRASLDRAAAALGVALPLADRRRRR